MKKIGNDTVVRDILYNNFKCVLDKDIECFLYDKAIDFEKMAKARTYLVCDEDALNRHRFLIYGYFALSLKVLILPEYMSIRQRKEIDGYRGKIHGVPIREIPCYLIGQLAKNSLVGDNPVEGKQLLGFAVGTIGASVQSVGGRYIMVECHNDEKIIDFYESNNFKRFYDEPTDDVQMIQLLRSSC